MVEKDEFSSKLLERLGMDDFQERFPWLGGELQTLRDTLRPVRFPKEKAQTFEIQVPSIPGSQNKANGYLLALLDTPSDLSQLRGLVLILHGLGGSSRRAGLRRMAISLQRAGFAVLRLNLRGAAPGRHLAGGTYSAKCNSDMLPVLARARKLCGLLAQGLSCSQSELPLLGVGISLGGTILLNACIEARKLSFQKQPALDGLICTSSPLDLSWCSASIERPRNRVYQRWLLNRLIKQTLSDPFGVSPSELAQLDGRRKDQKLPTTIREFDSVVTAPRWGFANVDAYYEEASPLPFLLKSFQCMPPTLFLQALDDPWVPAESAKHLEGLLSATDESSLQVLLTQKGGHNGFHGINGCWGDLLVENWFRSLGF